MRPSRGPVSCKIYPFRWYRCGLGKCMSRPSPHLFLQLLTHVHAWGMCIMCKKCNCLSSSICIKCSSKRTISKSKVPKTAPSIIHPTPPQHLPPYPPNLLLKNQPQSPQQHIPTQSSTSQLYQLYQPTHHLMALVYLATNLPTLNYPNDPKCTRLSMEVKNTWAWPRLWPCSRNQTNSSLAKRKASGGKGEPTRWAKREKLQEINK